MSKAAKVSSSFVLVAIAVLLSVESRVSAMPGPQAANSSQFEKLLTDRNIWGEDAFRVFASLDRWKGEPSILLFTDRVVGGSKFETPEQAREKSRSGGGTDDGAAILGVIRGLPEAYRETLILRLVEGLTGPEIAERTGLTAGSVRVNLHRGMQMLREKLG